MNAPSPSHLPAAGEGALGPRIVVLDDDPLGGQCIRDVPVLTTWSPEALIDELQRSRAFLLLTNTRALTRTGAIERAREVGLALRQAADATRLRVTPVWRSDSTLRGHFCWEMHAFEAAFYPSGAARPPCVFVPYFGEAGRVTQDDTQYVVQDDSLVPVHETEFARDPIFAFEQSFLPAWLETHSEGAHRAKDATRVSVEDLRHGGVGDVAERLIRCPAGGAVIVNALEDTDLETFVAGLHKAEDAGSRFLCTGAAPFIRARLGQERSPLLTPADLRLEGRNGGLTIVGSYVEKTTAQLRRALEGADVNAIEVRPGADGFEQIAPAVARLLANGEDVVLHTSRTHNPETASLFAEAQASVVGRLDVRPRYLVVKGGSTASHLATGVLGVRRAMVLGQLLTGVPVWRLGEESLWPGLPFVIFAGNVGTEESLAEALRHLRPSTAETSGGS